jgi:uncharacterized protein YlxP (DUF503 family)
MMAAKSIYCYTVWDRLQEKNILVRVPMKEVRERLGISAAKVNQYAVKRWVYKGKYLISKQRLDGKDMNEKINYEKAEAFIPKDLEESWNDMMKAAKLIRTGQGRIVTRKVGGKLIKYTEVIE